MSQDARALSRIAKHGRIGITPLALGLSLATLAWTATTLAQAQSWNGATPDWFTAGNWTPSGVPTNATPTDLRPLRSLIPPIPQPLTNPRTL